MSEHEQFIRHSLKLARAARAAGNHPFGALLVREGQILLTAENTVNTEQDITGHAELNLVRSASRQLGLDGLRGTTLYTSTEPCAMCTGAIVWPAFPQSCTAARRQHWERSPAVISSFRHVNW